MIEIGDDVYVHDTPGPLVDERGRTVNRNIIDCGRRITLPGKVIKYYKRMNEYSVQLYLDGKIWREVRVDKERVRKKKGLKEGIK